jgi:hypothetical protein
MVKRRRTLHSFWGGKVIDQEALLRALPRVRSQLRSADQHPAIYVHTRTQHEHTHTLAHTHAQT